jgi:hypothetical protein
VYTDSDPRFQSWVRENMQNKDLMEQMEQILATNAHTNADYTKQASTRILLWTVKILNMLCVYYNIFEHEQAIQD